MKEQAEQLQHVAIRVMGRFSMSREALDQLVGVLNKHVARLDAIANDGNRDAD